MGPRFRGCPGLGKDGGLEESLERAGVLGPGIWGDWAYTHREGSALRPGKEIGGVRETGLSDGWAGARGLGEWGVCEGDGGAGGGGEERVGCRSQSCSWGGQWSPLQRGEVGSGDEAGGGEMGRVWSSSLWGEGEPQQQRVVREGGELP